MASKTYTKKRLEGKIFTSKDLSQFKVVKYINNSKVLIQFTDSKYIQTVNSYHINYESVVNDFHPTVCDVGYTGNGKYICKSNKKPELAYKTWSTFLFNYYDSKSKYYKRKKVCKEWLNYQTFAEWYELNYYEIPNEKMILLVNDSNIISPETCFIIPFALRGFFYESDIERELPSGVGMAKNGKYKAYIKRFDNFENRQRKSVALGAYDTVELAFDAYSKAKKEYARYCADYYKEYIPYKLYNYLYNLEVKMY